MRVSAQALHRLLLFCILVGLGFALFATAETFDTGLQRSCSINPFFSCGAVDESGHTTLAGIPDWSIGVAGFVLLLVLDVGLLRTYDPRLLQAVLVLSTVGLAVALYLAYVELAIIHHLCPICLGDYVSIAVVLLVTLGLWWLRRADDDEPAARSESPAAASP